MRAGMGFGRVEVARDPKEACSWAMRIPEQMFMPTMSGVILV